MAIQFQGEGLCKHEETHQNKQTKKQQAKPKFLNSVVQKARGLQAAWELQKNAMFRATVKHIPKNKKQIGQSHTDPTRQTGRDGEHRGKADTGEQKTCQKEGRTAEKMQRGKQEG